jgi:primary-amine oxidase
VYFLAPHPLDPLSPSEITSTRDIILTYIQNNQSLQQLRSSLYFRQSQQQYIFNYITLQEPPKSVLLPYFLSNTPPPPDVTPRRSFAILISRSDSRVFEVTVNLSENRVEKWEEVTDPNSNPSLSPEDLNDSEAIARANPEVQRRCAALGYPNMSLVNADPWTIGYIGDRRRMMDPAFQGRRLIQLYLYGKNSATDNQYGK